MYICVFLCYIKTEYFVQLILVTEYINRVIRVKIATCPHVYNFIKLFLINVWSSIINYQDPTKEALLLCLPETAHSLLRYLRHVLE